MYLTDAGIHKMYIWLHVVGHPKVLLHGVSDVLDWNEAWSYCVLCFIYYYTQLVSSATVLEQQIILLAPVSLIPNGVDTLTSVMTQRKPLNREKHDLKSELWNHIPIRCIMNGIPWHGSWNQRCLARILFHATCKTSMGAISKKE